MQGKDKNAANWGRRYRIAQIRLHDSAYRSMIFAFKGATMRKFIRHGR